MPIDLSGITGLTQDSRAVDPGFLFAAFPGAKNDGRDYIADAVAKGARVILAPEGTPRPEGDIEFITDPEPRRLFAWLCAAFYADQPGMIAAVTGTNGKTSVVSFAAQIWEAMGLKAQSMGTLSGALTTPDSVTLHKAMAQAAHDGVTHLALEASSHGLAQYRLDGVRVKAAGFTNLSRDHLDYHETMEAYLAAKARLFSDVLEPGGVAVLNADVPEYKDLRAVCEKRGVRVLDYGRGGAAIALLSCAPLPEGQAVEIEIGGQRDAFVLPLAGEFQAMNALCALGLVIAEKPDDAQWLDRAVKALPGLRSVPGRLEPVTGHPLGAGIYVDYAHTPDALAQALEALRPHTAGRLLCVFGCGGDRDRGKRPLMGAATLRHADLMIVTDDNPRSEDPAAIRADILAACPPETLEIGGRREAIDRAVAMLEAGDVLLIAGKGHEQGQIFADRTEPFDDRAVAREALQTLNTNKRSCHS